MFICSFCEKYGNFFKIWMGFELNLVISDPNDIEVKDTFFAAFRFEIKYQHIIKRAWFGYR